MTRLVRAIGRWLKRREVELEILVEEPVDANWTISNVLRVPERGLTYFVVSETVSGFREVVRGDETGTLSNWPAGAPNVLRRAVEATLVQDWLDRTGRGSA